jgi:RNA polymerase sigma-70 factor (ECF subfamily)
MKNQAEKPAVVDEDIAEMVRRSVHKLPEKYATIVTLYYLQGVSYDEIAKAMDIPMGTLKTWMHRARKQLRDIVEEELEVNDAALG